MYKPGDYKVLCDLCGFVFYRSECLKNWKGQIVCKKDYETRHPQEFVKGRIDKQRVADPRPDNTDAMGYTTVKVTGSINAKTIDVNSISNISKNDSVGIVMDDGNILWTFVTADPAGDTIIFNDELTTAASAGNRVYTTGDTGDTFI